MATEWWKYIPFSPSQHQLPGEIQSARYVPSHHFAPPPLPPLPPPLEPVNTADEIYAEVSESPLTASSMVSGGSVDYEDGYILNVESVPRKPSKSFGQFILKCEG